MKRFLLFYYWGYYPSGGMDDCIGYANTEDELTILFGKIDELTKGNVDCGNAYFQVVDLLHMKYKEFNKSPNNEELIDFKEYDDLKPSLTF